MKKRTTLWIAMLLIAMLLVGCGSVEKTETASTEPSATVDTEVPAEAPTEMPTEVPTEVPSEEPAEEEVIYEGDASSYYIDKVYAEQIARYRTALSEKWNEAQYMENGMSEVLAAYYEGNPLDNVGFGFVDLDNDGHWELVIGAILDAEEYPAVFEIWTLVDEKPVMLAQAHARTQYDLQYVEEDNMWYVATECSNSIFCHGTYYLMLNEGKLDVMQGIIYNAEADEQNPWFMTYDMDWDASNDEPIDEDTAYAILESNRNHYTALEYFPYTFY